jgi:glycosyltransferase involved in cell wall biosynthesis
MRIGIEVQRIFREKKYGIEIAAIELIKKLIELEPNNNYVIFAKDDEDRDCLQRSENVKIKTLAGKLFADFEQFFLPIAARKEQVDILHCTGNTTPFFSPVPIVQTLHDVIFMDEISDKDTFYQRFGNHYRRRIVPLVTPRSEVVITVSQYEKDRIVSRLGVDPHKVHVVHNGINEKQFCQRRVTNYESLRKKYNLPEEYILFLGNTSYRKNSARVLEAYVKYTEQAKNPLPLVTPGLTRNYIANKLSSLKHAFDKRKFITPGYVSDEDLPSIYTLCKAFLFPSLSEGFGMPVIEAMACGSPVITSNVTSMPEISGNAALLVDPLQTSAITEALLSLTENENLRQQKIREGLVNARRFNWSRSAEKVLGLYESVFSRVKNPEINSRFLRKEYYTSRD